MGMHPVRLSQAIEFAEHFVAGTFRLVIPGST
jgi:hypothetical protein